MGITKWDKEAVIASYKKVVAKALDESGELVQETIKKSMRRGDYRPWPSKKGDGSIHWSSKPRKPPAPDTKRLKDSITYKVSDGSGSEPGPHADEDDGVKTPIAEGDEVILVVGSNVEYARVQEEGYTFEHRGTINLEERPYIMPAYRKNKSKIKRKLKIR
jgi:hypothetical protein